MNEAKRKNKRGIVAIILILLVLIVVALFFLLRDCCIPNALSIKPINLLPKNF